MKGVFIWLAKNHSIDSLVPRLKKSGTKFVAIKICDGTNLYPDLEPYFDNLTAAGIECGAWGYVYLQDPAREAETIGKTISRYRPSFFLLDLEEKKHLQNLAQFVANFPKLNYPVYLASYRYPSLHQEIDYKLLSKICQGNSPQIYWRNSDPIKTFDKCLKQYQEFMPETPLKMACGEMFFELGIKTKPDEMRAFYNYVTGAHKLPVIFWSYEQGLLHDDLWRTYSELGKASNKAKIIALRAPVYGTPKATDKPLGFLKRGTWVEVFDIKNGFANIGDSWIKVSKLSYEV